MNFKWLDLFELWVLYLSCFNPLHPTLKPIKLFKVNHLHNWLWSKLIWRVNIFKVTKLFFIKKKMKQKLLDAYEEQNVDAFTDSVSLYTCTLIKNEPTKHCLLYLTDQMISPWLFLWASPLFCWQVKEYDIISRLDQWLTTMLLRIKKTIQDEENDLCWISSILIPSAEVLHPPFCLEPLDSILAPSVIGQWPWCCSRTSFLSFYMVNLSLKPI